MNNTDFWGPENKTHTHTHTRTLDSEVLMKGKTDKASVVAKDWIDLGKFNYVTARNK